ncbi:MAG: hypothetical protein ABI347_11770 [Nitrososphaera sp.]|jgi:hypothetical protein
MSRFGFVSSGPPFEAHIERLDEPARATMIELRKFVMSLGANVIEEVRPHRVVYAKTLTFRTFLDVEPAVDNLIVEVRSSRQGPPERFSIKTQEDLDGLKNSIAQAYEKIR